MQFELYGLLSALLTFFFLFVPSAGATQMFNMPNSILRLLSDNYDPMNLTGTVALKVSQGTIICLQVFDVLTRTLAFTVYLALAVQLMRFAMDKKPHLFFINSTMFLTGIFATINFFLMYYINFVEMNPQYVPQSYNYEDINRFNRVGSVLGMCCVAILFWFVLPVYILSQGCRLGCKVTNGRLVLSA